MNRVQREVAARRTELARGRTDADAAIDGAVDRIQADAGLPAKPYTKEQIRGAIQLIMAEAPSHFSSADMQAAYKAGAADVLARLVDPRRPKGSVLATLPRLSTIGAEVAFDDVCGCGGRIVSRLNDLDDEVHYCSRCMKAKRAPDAVILPDNQPQRTHDSTLAALRRSPVNGVSLDVTA